MSTVVSDLPRAPGSEKTAPLRFVTAASLFDGHDAAINIMRRLIQAQGAEVIHLGHNRSVREIVDAAADSVALEIDRMAPGTGELDPRERTRAASGTRARRASSSS